MRHVLKIFSLLFVMVTPSFVDCQVTSVKYGLEQGASNSIYDFYLYIDKGSSTKVQHKIQFNAQISFVASAGASVEFQEYYAPIVAGRNRPLTWEIASRVLSPSVSPMYDYYGVTPVLGIVAMYDDLQEGDKIKLFSLKVLSGGTQDASIRIFRNGEDQGHQNEGMLGGDFSNGFTLGGIDQIFGGVVSEKNKVKDQVVQFID